MSSRRYGHNDSGQAAIVAALRAAGCSVISLAAVGRGVPDLLVAKNGRTWLLEVKQPLGPLGGKSSHSRALNPAQIEFATNWQGELWVARDVEDALHVIDWRESWPRRMPLSQGIVEFTDRQLRAVEDVK